MLWYKTLMDWIFGGSKPLPLLRTVRCVRVRGRVPGESGDWTARWVRATPKNVNNYDMLAQDWNGLYGSGTHTVEFGYINEAGLEHG